MTTLKEKIAVMQAYANGRAVLRSWVRTGRNGSLSVHDVDEGLVLDINPTWNWECYTYSIAKTQGD